MSAPALEAILRSRGDLTPAIVVEEATPEEHPLHDRFEWDDAKAGHAYRLVQAEQMIRAVRVTRTVDEGTEKERAIRVRGFIAERDLTGEQSGRYFPVERVVQDERLRQAALASMQREWMALKRKYAAFEEFSAMVLGDLEAGAA